MPFSIDYRLENSGWAHATISNGQQHESIDVSLLHDSLGSLTKAALELLNHPDNAQKVVFMSEPGEHQLLLKPLDSDILSIELRWYDDWASWGMHPNTDYELLFEAHSTPNDFGTIVQQNLESIWLKYGHQGYLDRWLEHEFPYQKYMKLTDFLTQLNNEDPL